MATTMNTQENLLAAKHPNFTQALLNDDDDWEVRREVAQVVDLTSEVFAILLNDDIRLSCNYRQR